MSQRNTGAEILSIKPDAEMGLGQDTNIPVPVVELDQVNKAADDIRLYDHQRAIMKYDHQLKQQDRLLQGLSEDAVAVGAILPEDMDYFKEAENEDRKAFLAVKSMEPNENGQNVEYDDYVRKHQKLKDAAAVLQSRYVAIQKLRQQRAEATLPEEQKALDDHIAREMARPKTDPIRPYQKAFTMDLDKMIANAQTGGLLVGGNPANIPSTTTKETVGPKGTTIQTTTKPAASGGGGGPVKTKGTVPVTGEAAVLGPNGELPIIITEPDQKWDYKTFLRNTTKEYVSDEAGRVNQQRIYDIFQGADSDIPKNVLQEWNKRLAQHDQQNGIESIKVPGVTGPPDPNNPGSIVGRMIDTHEYPNAINYRMVGNKVVILDDVPTFNAKVALANVKGDYVIKGKKSFDENAFKLNMENAKNKADIMLKGAQAQGEKAKAGWYWQKAKDIKDKAEQEKLIQDGYRENLYTQQQLVGANGALAQIPNQLTTPVFTFATDKNGTAKPQILKPIGADPIYGTDPKNPATYGKVVGYKGGYYNQEYQYNGKVLTPAEMNKQYQEVVSATTEEQRKQGNINTLNDYIKAQIRRKNYDVKLVGENGSTNENFHTQAMKKSLGSTKNMAEFYSENPEQ